MDFGLAQNNILHFLILYSMQPRINKLCIIPITKIEKEKIPKK